MVKSSIVDYFLRQCEKLSESDLCVAVLPNRGWLANLCVTADAFEFKTFERIYCVMISRAIKPFDSRVDALICAALRRALPIDSYSIFFWNLFNLMAFKVGQIVESLPRFDNRIYDENSQLAIRACKEAQKRQEDSLDKLAKSALARDRLVAKIKWWSDKPLTKAAKSCKRALENHRLCQLASLRTCKALYVAETYLVLLQRNLLLSQDCLDPIPVLS